MVPNMNENHTDHESLNFVMPPYSLKNIFNCFCEAPNTFTDPVTNFCQYMQRLQYGAQTPVLSCRSSWINKQSHWNHCSVLSKFDDDQQWRGSFSPIVSVNAHKLVH